MSYVTDMLASTINRIINEWADGEKHVEVKPTSTTSPVLTHGFTVKFKDNTNS